MHSAVVPLDVVIGTECLARRPARKPDTGRESEITLDLTEELARFPKSIFQRLVDAILNLCEAHSAGISLLDPERSAFYWPAVVGRWAHYAGEGVPRGFSPCGTVLDRNTTVLVQSPERHFAYLQQAAPAIQEGLLVPFRLGGEPVGTLWAISHDAGKLFDAEDARLLRNLSGFTSMAYKALRDSGELRRLYPPVA